MADRFASPSPRHAIPLVGREREQSVLRDALATALAGRGSLVLIGGEAGIGKTTLAESLLHDAATRGALVLVGRCYDLAETPPYGPWAEALARAPRGDSPSTPPDLDGTGVASQAALFAALRDYLTTLVATQPLVLLLEDLHWADPATLDLLRALARGLGDWPLLLLATYRADELQRRHPLYQLLPTLVREAQALRIAVRPLDHAALPAFLRARYALPPPDEARLVAYLATRAEGNPFYAGELLRSLEEAGTLRHDAATWSLGDLAGQRVPALLRQILDIRLDRLGEVAREHLAVGAVLGQELTVAHWAAVAGVPEDDLLETIELATEARLLAESADGEHARFAHALVREALYEGLPPTRRRALHRRIAESLAATPAPDPDAVADHFRRAGDARAAEWLDRAAERARRAYAWRMAADRLEAALTIHERHESDLGTRGWLLLRLGLFLRHADRPRASALLNESVALADQARDALLQAHARFSDGLVRAHMQDYRAGIGEMEAAIGALDALAPLEAEMRARLRGWGLADDPDHQRGTLALWYAFTGRFDEAVALGEAVAARGATADAAWLAGAFAPDALRGLGFAYAVRGRPDEARTALERNLSAYRAAGDLGQAAGTASWLLRLVFLPYRTDDLAQRRRAVAEARRDWARTGGIGTPLRGPIFVAPLPLLEGHWEESRAIADAATDLRPDQNGWAQKALALVPLALAQGDRAVAWATMREALPDGPATAPGELQITEFAPLIPLTAALALADGELAEARAWLECLDRLLAAAGAVLWRAEGALGWASYHRASGDLATARRHAQSALAHATEPRQPLALLAAHRLLGELDTATGHYDEAAQHLAASLALADACAAPYERALTLLALADLQLAMSDRPEAEATLAEARAILIPLEARPALARADALATRLASSPAPARPAPGLPFGLTPREAEVLRLLGEGLPDAEIAARLFVSRNTVNAHAKAIYGKLGVTSRAAAARLARDHGLA